MTPPAMAPALGPEEWPEPTGRAVPVEVAEVVDEPAGMGVDEVFAAFVDLLGGRDDGLGDPRGALRDVAVIEAGLTSNGSPISFDSLIPQF